MLFCVLRRCPPRPRSVVSLVSLGHGPPAQMELSLVLARFKALLWPALRIPLKKLIPVVTLSHGVIGANVPMATSREHASLMVMQHSVLHGRHLKSDLAVRLACGATGVCANSTQLLESEVSPAIAMSLDYRSTAAAFKPSKHKLVAK